MQFSCELVCSTEVNACFLKKPQGGLDFCVKHCFGNNLCFKFVMPAPDSQQKKKYVFLWLNKGDYFEWVNLAVVQVPSFSLFGTFVICIKIVWKLQWVTGSPVQGETGCEGGISTFWRITLFLFRVTKWMYLSVLQTNTFLVWQPAAPSTCSAVSNLLNNFTWGLCKQTVGLHSTFVKSAALSFHNLLFSSIALSVSPFCLCLPCFATRVRSAARSLLCSTALKSTTYSCFAMNSLCCGLILPLSLWVIPLGPDIWLNLNISFLTVFSLNTFLLNHSPW